MQQKYVKTGRDCIFTESLLAATCKTLEASSLRVKSSSVIVVRKIEKLVKKYES